MNGRGIHQCHIPRLERCGPSMTRPGPEELSRLGSGCQTPQLHDGSEASVTLCQLQAFLPGFLAEATCPPFKASFRKAFSTAVTPPPTKSTHLPGE